MKKITLVLTLTLSVSLVLAQPGKTKPTTPAKTAAPAKTGVKTPVVTAPLLKNMNDSASYAIGVSIANFYKQQGVTKLNTGMCSRAINDVLAEKPALLNDATANDMMNRFMNSLHTTSPKPAVPAKTAVKKPGNASPFQNLTDSASYAIGMSVADFYKQQGVTKLNTTVVSRAISDIMGNKTALISDMAANDLMNRYMTDLQEAKSKPNIDAGNAFLAVNKTKPGVQVTPSGLQYEVVREGNGAKPLASDSVTCNYMGTLINGTEFDNSYKRGQPITFSLRGVIPGWTEGLQLMSVGSKYKLYVPYTLAYGAFDYGPIPGGSALIFEIELLDVKKGPGGQ